MRALNTGHRRFAGPFLFLCCLCAATAASQEIQKLPVGAGAIGKGPDAIVLPGYADVPRPPAFTAEVRAEVLRQSTLVDDYHPQPAFLGQTRAPKPAKTHDYRVEVVTEGLDRPWSLAMLPDGRMMVAETGRGIRIIERDGKAGPPITQGLPIDFSKRAQQLLDTIPDRDFARNRVIYFLYRVPPPEAGDIGAGEEDFPVHYPQIQMVARARLAKNERSVTDVEVLLNAQGIEGRMLQGPDGKLYIDSGPLAGRGMLARNWQQSQLPGSLMGKVLRINTDGSIPRDNPFVGRADTRPEIWAFGVRDAQSMAFDSQGRLWTAENGAMGGDEINLIEPGKNYGFPTIVYGREYNGELINGGLTQKEGLEQPVYFWTPSVAPSGMTFYSGDLFPNWKGDLFVTTLAPRIGRKLIRIVLEKTAPGETPHGVRVAGEEWLMTEMEGLRIRDVKQGADGALYVVSDVRGGAEPDLDKLYRIVPR
jgi:glucose/arabinose dehydrogenase